jgi:hypothetical protein
MKSDKRKHTRFFIKGGAYAAFNDGKTRLGKIKNICLGGLSFEYIREEVPPKTTGFLDIFSTEKSFYLRDIPCAVAYDESSKAFDSPFSSIPINQCGIRFIHLSPNESKEIKKIIERCKCSRPE